MARANATFSLGPEHTSPDTQPDRLQRTSTCGQTHPTRSSRGPSGPTWSCS